MNKLERLKKAVAHLKGRQIISTQNDIVIKMNGNKSNISSALNGKENYLTDGFLMKFCDAFTDINYNWLLTGEGQMLKSESSINPNKTAMESKTLIDELKDRISSLEKQLNEKQQFCTFLMKQNDELRQLVTGIPEIKKKEAV